MQVNLNGGLGGSAGNAHPAGSVDENLFYKGVDKSIVHGARLQTHNAEGAPGEPAQHSGAIQPPYPFTVRHASFMVLLKIE